MALLKPDADVADGGWITQVGGTSLFSVIDETTPADADYARSENFPDADIFRVRLEDPGGAIIAPMTVSYRIGKSGDVPVDMTVRLYQGATLIVEWEHSDIDAAFTTIDQTLTAPQFAAISDFTDLELEFEATANAYTPSLDFSDARNSMFIALTL